MPHMTKYHGFHMFSWIDTRENRSHHSARWVRSLLNPESPTVSNALVIGG